MKQGFSHHPHPFPSHHPPAHPGSYHHRRRGSLDAEPLDSTVRHTASAWQPNLQTVSWPQTARQWTPHDGALLGTAPQEQAVDSEPWKRFEGPIGSSLSPPPSQRHQTASPTTSTMRAPPHSPRFEPEPHAWYPAHTAEQLQRAAGYAKDPARAPPKVAQEHQRKAPEPTALIAQAAAANAEVAAREEERIKQAEGEREVATLRAQVASLEAQLAGEPAQAELRGRLASVSRELDDMQRRYGKGHGNYMKQIRKEVEEGKLAAERFAAEKAARRKAEESETTARIDAENCASELEESRRKLKECESELELLKGVKDSGEELKARRAAETARDELSEMLDSERAARAKAEAEVRVAERSLAGVKHELEGMQLKYGKGKETKLAAVRKAAEDGKEALELLEAEEAAREAAQEEAAAATAREEAANGKLRVAKQRVEMLEKRINDSNEAVIQKERDLRVRAEEEAAMAKAREEETRIKLEDEQRRANQSEAELREGTNKVNELESTVAQERWARKEAEEELEEAKAREEGFVRKIDTFKAEIASFKEGMGGQMEDMTRLRLEGEREADRLQQKLEAVKSELKESREEVLEIREELHSEKAAHEATQKRLRELQGELSRCEEALRESRAREEGFVRKIEALGDQVPDRALEKELQEATKELDRTRELLPPDGFEYGERYYQCQIEYPGVGYRFTPNFADKTKDGTGPMSPEVVVATQICQGPESIFIKCNSGRGWLPVFTNKGQTCFKHLGRVEAVDLEAQGLSLAANSANQWFDKEKQGK